MKTHHLARDNYGQFSGLFRLNVFLLLRGYLRNFAAQAAGALASS
jgi:hypothetical protein